MRQLGNNLVIAALARRRQRSNCASTDQKCRHPAAATGTGSPVRVEQAHARSRLDHADRRDRQASSAASARSRRSPPAGRRTAARNRRRRSRAAPAGSRLLLRRPTPAAGESGSGASRQRRADPRGLADMAEIGEQAVRHVAHRMRDADQARPERGARLGQLEAARPAARSLGCELADTRRATPSARERRRRSCR